MLSIKDLSNIVLPALSHWIVWLAFLVIVIPVLLLYIYPKIKKSRKEFHFNHLEIPITAVISLYIFTKMLEGIVYKGSILKADTWINEAMLALRSPFMTSIAFFITRFGSGTLSIIIVIFTIGILLLIKRWRYAILSLVAILGSTLLQYIIKDLVNRARPPNSLEVISPGAFSASFPSGHAITAIVFVSLLIYSFKDDIKHAALKYISITAASAFFITVGLTRIYLSAHWFSDVIAGMSLGLFWFMLIVLVERAITGLVPAIKLETKKAEPIKTTEVVRTAKKIIPKK